MEVQYVTYIAARFGSQYISNYNRAQYKNAIRFPTYVIFSTYT